MIIFLVLIATILPAAQAVGQDFVIDQTLINLGTRYRNQVNKLYHETGDNSVLVHGNFMFGVPQVPWVHKMSWNGQPVALWAPDFQGSSSSGGPLFSRATDGYWLEGGFTLRKMTLNWEFVPNLETNNGPFESFEATCSWTDEQDMVYAGGIFIDWSTIPPSRTALLRHYPDGSLDESFPLVPTRRIWTLTSNVGRITEYDQNRLVLSGNFDSIQGHHSPRIAMMFKTGIIDTSFTSPFGHYGEAYPVHKDDQGRMLIWYLHSTRENPLDTAEVWRMMPDGNLDPAFAPMRLTSIPRPQYGLGTQGGMSGWSAIQTATGGYIIGGFFDFANGVPRKCLAEIDSSGQVLPVVFETNQLFMDTILHPWFTYPGNPLIQVFDLLETPDGSILIGGRFSGFNGQVSLNLVKIKRDPTTGTWQVDAPDGASVYPNPAGAQVHVSVQDGRQFKSITAYDLTGRLVYSQTVTGTQATLNTSMWGAGTYVLSIAYQNGDVERKRVVVE